MSANYITCTSPNGAPIRLNVDHIETISPYIDGGSAIYVNGIVYRVLEESDAILDMAVYTPSTTATAPTPVTKTTTP